MLLANKVFNKYIYSSKNVFTHINAMKNIGKFFCSDKKDEGIEGKVIEAQTKSTTLSQMYNITSKKLGPPDIHKIIDESKFKHKNVQLGRYSSDQLNKPFFVHNKKMIPMSPKLGPFEVFIIFYIQILYLFTIDRQSDIRT
jgi:hypothetical protein